MAKKQILILIAAVLLIGLGIAGYLYWQKSKAPTLTPEEQALKQAGEAVQKVTAGVTQVVLPSMGVQTNPLEKAPDINPADQANPFKDIKTNPFR